MSKDVATVCENKNKKITRNLMSALIGFILVLLLHNFIFFTVISGESMYPTYSNGDVVLAIKKNEINRNDIIIFKSLDDNNLKRNVIKRVIALPGETIKITCDGVLINNDLYIYDNFESMKDSGIAYQEITLKEDEYFVLGDNRNNSKDSRYIGPIKQKDIKGTVVINIIKH